MVKVVHEELGIEEVDTLYLVQGFCECGYVLEQDVKSMKRMMDVNYFGSLFTFKGFLPGLLKSKKKGKKHIVFVGSACSMLNFSGYTTYAPTKFALKGLVEGLANEFQGFNLEFHLAVPPDTDTPGWHIENKNKPEDCQLMSEAGGLYTAEKSANEIIRCLKRKRFYLTESFEMNCLVYTTRGFGPLGNECPFMVLMKTLFFAFPGVIMVYDFAGKSLRFKKQKKERWDYYIKEGKKLVKEE